MKIDLTSGSLQERIEIPEENLIGILTPPERTFALKDSTIVIRDAIEHPCDSPQLDQILNTHSTVAIVVDDHTRPTPTKVILEVLLEKLRAVGVQDKNITITIGNGLHRATTPEEKLIIFGKDILKKYDIKDHEARDKNVLTYIGGTTSGTPLFVNTRVVKADQIITLGMIKAHAFAGFSGGAKSILPAISGKETILHNHGYDFIEYPKGLLGDVEKNAVRKDMEEAASKLPVFIVNVVLDMQKRIAGAFAGNVITAHRKGLELFRKMAAVQLNEQADVVIVEGSYPASENLYFAVFGAEWAINVGLPIVKQGGTVILPTQCREGIEGGIIEKLFATSSSPAQVLEYLKNSPPVEEQWAVQLLAYCLLERDIVLVSPSLTPEVADRLMMRYFPTTQDALDNAFKTRGEKIKILVIKHADFLIADVC
jgi:nickel-dependent lactate racemase